MVNEKYIDRKAVELARNSDSKTAQDRIRRKAQREMIMLSIEKEERNQAMMQINSIADRLCNIL